MHKIKRVSLLFRYLFQVAAIIWPIMVILFWFYPPFSTFVINSRNSTISFHLIPEYIQILAPLTISTRLLGFLISLLYAGVIESIFYFLYRLFRLYEQGEIFSIFNIKYIRNTGYAIFIEQLLHPIYEFLISATLTWHNPPGHRYATITFTSLNMAMIFTALLIILISWIMAEGHKLNEEQKYIV